MKHFILGILALLPLCAHADVVSTKNNGNIENVKVISVAADSVVYKQGDIRKAIASEEVEGVLYENGKFVTPPAPRTVSTQSEEEDDDDYSWAHSNKQVQVGNRAISVPKVVSKMKDKWGGKAAMMKAQKKELKSKMKAQEEELREYNEQMKAQKKLQRANRREESETNGNSSDNTSEDGNW